MLRLDWNILFNIINLLILYFLMKRFLFKPVNAILEKRQAEADSQFAQADEREAQAQEKKQQYEKMAADIEIEKEKVMAEARKEAAAEYERIVDEAQGRAGDIVEKARKNAEAEKEATLRQADAQVRDLVVAAVARMAGMAEDAESDRALYDKFLEKANQGQ